MSTTHEPQLPTFEAALARAEAEGPEADDELVDAVRAMDAAGKSAVALRTLATHPHAVLHLDEAIRRTSTWRYGGRGRAEQPFLAADLSPLGVALATGHPDGRIRERAVRRLRALWRQQQPPIELLPFLVLRTADWAEPVRERARAALAVLLHDDPKRLVPAAAPITLLISRRERGSFAQQQLLVAMAALPGTAAYERFLVSPDARLRRFVLRAALTSGLDGRRLPLRTLVAVVKRDSDRRCRELAAEAVVREAVWTERTDLLRQFAASDHQEVRVLALAGLTRTGRAAEVTPYLDDRSALVRATARDAARRTGTDALGWYRAAVLTPSPGGIAGLAEIGGRDEADLLTPLLGHPDTAVRAAAVRGLRALDAVPVEPTVALLRDPSTKVVREATAALRHRIDELPGGLAASLLADHERAAVRRAGFRLLDRPDLLHEPDVSRRIRTALSVAADPDPRLARWAAGEATRLIRAVAPSPWRTNARAAPAPAFDPTADDRRDLLALAEAVASLPSDRDAHRDARHASHRDAHRASHREAHRASVRPPRPLSYRTHQLLHERLDSASPATELLRVRYGPHPDTANPLLGLEATFSAKDPHAAVALMREVLLAVLPYAAGPASDWPADDQWPDILPTWFVERCAPETPARVGAASDWLAWWRGLTGQQRDMETRTDAVADWQLLDWISLFEPEEPAEPEGTADGTADEMTNGRSWRWWDGGVRGHSTGWVRFGTDGHPYGGRGALLWLIEAAGGYDVEIP